MPENSSLSKEPMQSDERRPARGSSNEVYPPVPLEEPLSSVLSSFQGLLTLKGCVG